MKKRTHHRTKKSTRQPEAPAHVDEAEIKKTIDEQMKKAPEKKPQEERAEEPVKDHIPRGRRRRRAVLRGHADL